MRILLDENVCMGLAAALRKDGHEVLAIAEGVPGGLPDDEVWGLACQGPFLLLTRDYHFTNAVRFNASACHGIVFLRHGNLKAGEEVALVRSFLSSNPLEEFQGKLVTLSSKGIRIRESS